MKINVYKYSTFEDLKKGLYVLERKNLEVFQIVVHNNEFVVAIKQQKSLAPKPKLIEAKTTNTEEKLKNFYK
jgi:hypothetical protein